jgi:tetratricopeptide (TPR) repeat protein
MTFDPALLVHVLEEGARQPDAETWQRLSRYFAEDGDGRRRFRRGVVREVAYARLPFATRRQLHAAVGASLEAELGDAAAEEAAILSVHFAEAGAHEAAWRYSHLAGERAGQEYAYADAVVLYRRALDAARHLDVPAVELAATWEAVGDAAAHTGEPRTAMAAFTAARSVTADDPLRDAELLHRHARVEFDCGHVRQAVRWVMRALRRLEGMDGQAATALRAHLVGTLATIRWRAGRFEDAAELSRQGIAEAEAAGEEAALARACFILDTALLYSGQAVDGRHFRRALEIYERLGDLDRQAAVLNNMGIAAYWGGHWDEAIELYRRAAQASEAAGDAGNAAFGDCNVGEVLSDQGHIAEAEPLLRRARRIWRGTGNEGGAAFVTALLGRAATRSGDLELAGTLLAEAVAAFAAAGAVGDAAWADALRAEAAAHAGDADDALRRADRLLLDHAGTGRLAPLLHRVRGFALAQQGRYAAAEGALGASLAEARLQHEDYEVATSLRAWQSLSAHCGWQSDPTQAEEAAGIMRRLGVVRLPGAPLVSATALTAAGTSAFIG